MPESFTTPEIRHAKNVDDAIIMLSGQTQLTHGERKLITQSLYDLAFQEGARQGRLAGTEHVYNIIRERMGSLDSEDEFDNYALTVLQSVLSTQNPCVEMVREDTTATIRRNLEDKQRAVAQLTKNTL